jgi:hypothetical protein
LSKDNSTSSERTTIGRIAANTRWGNTLDRSAATAPARSALEQKFLDQADGDPVRAASVRKAYYARLNLASVKARRARKSAS